MKKFTDPYFRYFFVQRLHKFCKFTVGKCKLQFFYEFVRHLSFFTWLLPDSFLAWGRFSSRLIIKKLSLVPFATIMQKSVLLVTFSAVANAYNIVNDPSLKSVLEDPRNAEGFLKTTVNIWKKPKKSENCKKRNSINTHCLFATTDPDDPTPDFSRKLLGIPPISNKSVSKSSAEKMNFEKFTRTTTKNSLKHGRIWPRNARRNSMKTMNGTGMLLVAVHKAPNSAFSTGTDEIVSVKMVGVVHCATKTLTSVTVKYRYAVQTRVAVISMVGFLANVQLVLKRFWGKMGQCLTVAR